MSSLHAVRYIFRFYSCETIFINVNVKPFLLFTAISYERKHVSMLGFCFCGHTFMAYLQTIKVHNDSVLK